VQASNISNQIIILALAQAAEENKMNGKKTSSEPLGASNCFLCKKKITVQKCRSHSCSTIFNQRRVNVYPILNRLLSSPLANSRENNASTHLLVYGCFPSTLWRHTGRKHKRDKCCLRCRPSSAWLPAEDKVHWSRVAK
jgi:hypothetical protein